ncbi:glycosyltransferase [Hyphomicrobium sp. CS1GBMeth3]|uniref:glycosyltransferase n=1 Tax=Hyphomicrobium sp. CS1GBMeth3 TaxID=1892845 RepID=UPI0009306956|nr:glycosyltransferase [Hyphomicrobium sp. CS1GBMeth3]
MSERLDGRVEAARQATGLRAMLAWSRSRQVGLWRAPARPTLRKVPSPSPSERGGADIDQAAIGLRRLRPDLSAGEPTWAWQKWTLVSLLVALGGAGVAVPQHALFVLVAVLVLPFSCVVALRSAALWFTAADKRRGASAGSVVLIAEAELPRYSLLVPLYDEADVVPDLVAALSAIDYPRDRLEVFLIVEAADLATRRAVSAVTLPSFMTVVIVPDGNPRTKPRALNFALHCATGDVVVVYDAEDVPEPDQLRRAAGLLAASPRIGCVQARLNVLNADETWLTRQFAIEYTALFDCLLPTFERLGLPVPLGGTSNHFPRAVLEKVGAWDPYNVTEDADLGIRLARFGLDVKVVASTTWEEAPDNFSSWRNQRTRWLKGWMQTYLVHMRRPLETARDLGWARFFGFQVLMGGLILSALVHPWFYVAAAVEVAFGPLQTLHHHALSDVITALGLVNLVLGYVTGVALGWAAVVGRGRWKLAVWALTMPIYWLFISFAAYRALLQLASAPYKWEKTRHRPRAAFIGQASAAAGTGEPSGQIKV